LASSLGRLFKIHDGASKGNPGIAGYGGVLRNAKGSIVFIFHCNLGTATNNMAELMAMEQCLDLLKQDNYLNVMIEADLELIINSVQKIHNGIVPDKVSKHWKLIQVFQRIQSHLQGLCTISFHHVRRKANKLVDLLANQGVSCTENNVSMKWQELSPIRLRALHCEQAEEYRDVFRLKTMETSSI